jgi:hypothetical protein
VIGTLRAPDNSGAESIDPRLNNFSEYFGDTLLCDKVPTSDVIFRQPAASGATTDVLANYDPSSPSRGVCTGGSVTQVGSDARVQLGGAR